MIIGNTYYYRLVGGYWISCAEMDSDTPAPNAPDLAPFEAAVWSPANQPGPNRYHFGADASAHQRRTLRNLTTPTPRLLTFRRAS